MPDVEIETWKSRKQQAAEPAEWAKFRRNHYWCEQTGDWAPLLLNGKPDFQSPRKHGPKGMPTPDSKIRSWNPRA
jgi:hypothetical protein